MLICIPFLQGAELVITLIQVGERYDVDMEYLGKLEWAGRGQSWPPRLVAI